MKSIWEIDSTDVIGLQGRDTDFAHFVNGLLAQQASAGQLANALQLNLKTQAPDGGVDAAVSQALPGASDPEGFFDVPTCWQYKASPTRNIKPSKGKKRSQEAALRQEIQKPEAARLIKSGYGYRFCISDGMPPPMKTKWEAWLSEEAKTLNPNAPAPKVVTAAELALWANRLPGSILPFCPYLHPFQSLRIWRTEITYQTPHFVLVGAWQGAMEVLRKHANLTEPCHRVLLRVQGVAGVGKTRCVYEALAAREENQALVVYTRNEMEAEKIADILANDHRFRGFIVADECSVPWQVRIEKRLESHQSRLRVIAIDNTLQEEPSGAGEIRLDRMSDAEVEQILERHFSQLSPERLRAFVTLSGGFVRLARELCTHSDLIPPEGDIGPVIPYFRDRYLYDRLPRDEDRAAIQAIALLPKVGFKGDIRHQLEGLCQAVGLQPDKLVETARRLKQAPGFVALGERYLYVTPQLIAQAAFQSAWEQWIRADPERFFLVRLPGELVDQFVEQLRACGTSEMCQTFFRFFQNWTTRLSGPDLADEATVRRLVRLVEVEPQTLFPLLRRLVESLPIEELRQFHARPPGGPEARRELVWLADKFLRLPEYFGDAERILLRLALAETEVYANNATGVWKEIFRPLLSGTAIPFSDRLRLLEQRFQTSDQAQLALCLGALEGPLTVDGPILGRALGPPVIAGRIPPANWWPPAGYKDLRECWVLTLALLKRLAHSSKRVLRNGILKVTGLNLIGLLRHGFLSEIIEIIGPDPLMDVQLAEWLHQVDRFLELYCAGDAKRVPLEFEEAVRDWRRRLVPDSMHGRLVAVVGQEPWHLRGHGDDHGEGALTALARELLQNPTVLDQELPWLCSREARSATRLGMLLGNLDNGASLLEPILKAAAPSRYPGIAAGYLQGLLHHHPEHGGRANDLLDRFQQSNPRAVFDLISRDLGALRPFERLVAMVDAGQLPVEFLRSVAYGNGNGALPSGELRQVLNRLLPAARQGNEAAARAAVHVLWKELRPGSRPARPDLLLDPELKPLVRTTLEISLPVIGQEGQFWVEVLEDLGQSDPESAIRLAVLALAGDDWHLTQQTLSYLESLAGRHPDAVMESFGEALINPALGWRLGAHRLHELVEALPADLVIGWLNTHGRPAAIGLARHLPLPFVDASGKPVLPELTANVLEKFEEDERVFQEFCAGGHSGQMYEGDIAAQHEQEGEVARRFLDHPLRLVREWAQYEIDRAAHEASWWRARDEELSTP
jgi:hypothetical protein